MTSTTPEMRKARANLGNMIRWRGRDSAEAIAARQDLTAAQLAEKLAEARELAAELAEYSGEDIETLIRVALGI